MRRLFRKILKNSRSKEDGIFFTKLTNILGFKPNELQYYKKAFTHRSVNKTDSDGNPFNYERLEFLGDAMLGSVIAAYLYQESPAGDEGYLTKMRSKIVSREHLNERGRDLNFISFLESKISAQHFSDNIYGNIFEAFIGAIYLDKGYQYCEEFIHEKVIKPYIDIIKLEGKVISYKSLIIEWCQKEKKTFQFEVFEDTGIENQKFFSIRLLIDGSCVAKGRATSKKKAEEKAAKRAFYVLQERING